MGQTVVTSSEHLFHLTENNVAKCSFERPCPARSFVRRDDTIATGPVTALSADVLNQYSKMPNQIGRTNDELLESILRRKGLPEHRRRASLMCGEHSS